MTTTAAPDWSAARERSNLLTLRLMAWIAVHLGRRVARKHIGWYTSGLHGSAEFRHAFNQILDVDAAKAALRGFYSGLMDGAYT